MNSNSNPIDLILEEMARGSLSWGFAASHRNQSCGAPLSPYSGEKASLPGHEINRRERRVAIMHGVFTRTAAITHDQLYFIPSIRRIRDVMALLEDDRLLSMTRMVMARVMEMREEDEDG